MTEPTYYHDAVRCANCTYCESRANIAPQATTRLCYCTKFCRPVDENKVCYEYETK